MGFTPFTMSTNGGFGGESKKLYNKPSEKKAEKRYEHYSVVSTWVR